MNKVILFVYLFIRVLNAFSDLTTTPSYSNGNALEECLTETKANMDHVVKLKEGSWNITPDAALKKWVLCFLERMGVMSSEAVLRQDIVLQNIPDNDKSKVEKVIDKCLFKKRHEPFETAWHYISCFHSQEPKYAKIANHI